ncbi:hypothetical protein JCM19046_1786 [Bacillus sp. JCM 19046]|nr:hypothetical protein JCM19045_2743 [Bacillus sp. JCM 19045]GAF17281.1 hypothetical protein JCM19046_1786 [Bacillus sp. JCM 19046]
MLSGCSNEDDVIHVMAFSDELYAQQEELTDLTEGEIRVTVFPSIIERLLVELAGHDADILLIDESLKVIVDPDGLVSLANRNLPVVPIQDETTSVAVSLSELLTTLSFEENHLLFIPVYSNRNEEAIQLLEKWREGEFSWN